MMARDPYATPRLLMFWFLAVAVGLVALGALVLIVATLNAIL